MRAAQGVVDDACAHRLVADAVNQHKAAGGAVVGVSVKHQWLVGGQVAFGHHVQVQLLSGHMLQGVDIDQVLDARHASAHNLRAALEPVVASGRQGLSGHPDDVGLQLVGHGGRSLGGAEHVAARDIYLIRQRQRHRLAGHGTVQVSTLGNDARHLHLAA